MQNCLAEISELNKLLIEYESKETMYEEKFLSLEQLIRNLENSNEKYHNQIDEEE